MTTSGSFAPDTGALSSLLDAGNGPVLVLDPCGELWEAFWQAPVWKNSGRPGAWRPGRRRRATSGTCWPRWAASMQRKPVSVLPPHFFRRKVTAT